MPDRRLYLLAICLVACGSGGASLASGAWALAGLLFAIGLAALVPLADEYRSVRRLAARLGGDASPGRPLKRLLVDLADRYEGLDQRLTKTHPVTGLPTREALVETIGQDGRDCRPVLMGAVRLVDFDRLAGFDQAAANAVLKQFARRLTRATKASHLVCQVDRDCFVIWFRGAPDLVAANAEFNALAQVAGNELLTESGVHVPAIEVSVVRFPGDGADPEALVLRLTGTLKRLDRGDGGGVLISAAPSVERAREDFFLEQDLAQAIADDQLTMVFQPVVELSQNRVMGAEALLRWDHPRLGAISPTRFIPLVETLGLSDQYGLWVLNAACREARRWRDEGLTGLKVAVNLSAKQLGDPALQKKIERTLQRHDLSPKALELELTETAAMADADRTFALFGDLRDMGVSLAIDDFGAGYSSLSYLKNLPFDKLKIDREFVTAVHQRRDSQAICRALIELGRGLDLVILAEGVECAEEVAVLQDLGCRVFQGYHFSKPLAGEAFRAKVRDTRWLIDANPSTLSPCVAV